MRLLKGIWIAILSISLIACTKENENQKVSILVPQGAPALALLGLYDHENVTINTVSGSDAIQAELSKKDTNYDVIVAPINMGAMLIQKNQTQFLLDRVVTWGNLYIVASSEDALTQGNTFAAFGENAVPQKVLNSSMDMSELSNNITYYPSANEVSAALLAKKADVGLLAEPAVTATIAKAKKQGISLAVVKDLQQEYQKKQSSTNYGYPQAALFVKKDSIDKVQSYLEDTQEFMSTLDVEKVSDYVSKIGEKTLGVPSGEIAQASWKRQNIHIVKANEVKDDIAVFLKAFHIDLSSEAYTK